MAKEPEKITTGDVLKAQSKWAEAIVEIGSAYTAGRDVTACAKKHIETLYAYDDGPVLFKPTKCKERQFRSTIDGALSYFVGHEFAKGEFPKTGFTEDQGFAIAPFISVRFMNVDIIPGLGRAIAMGNYFFETTEGAAVKVEFTFGYRRLKRGIVIDLHHSSIPYHEQPSAESTVSVS